MGRVKTTNIMKKLRSIGHGVKESVLHKSIEEASNMEQIRKDRRYQQKYPQELVDKYVQKMIEIFNLPPKTPIYIRLIAPCSHWEEQGKEWVPGELVITRKNLCFISETYHQSAARQQVKSVKKTEIKRGENELLVKYGDKEMKLKNLTPDNERRAIKIIGHFAKNKDSGRKSLRGSLLGVPSRKKKKDKDSDSDSDSEITDLSDISAEEHDEVDSESAREFDEIAKQDEEEERKRLEQEEADRKRKEQEEEQERKKEQEEERKRKEEKEKRRRKKEERKRKEEQEEQQEEEERKRK